MWKNLLPLLGLVLLAGCVGAAKSVSSIVSYDLGTIRPAANNRVVAMLRSIDVFAVSWLDSTAMQYRLLYAGPQRRQSYADSRWAAPPAELLAHALRRHMLSGEAQGACRLRVDLDEFVQLFDSAQASRVVLDARVQLIAPAGGEILARRGFNLSRPAATADAAGGAAAMAEAVGALAAELHDWLGALEQQQAAQGPSRRCQP